MLFEPYTINGMQLKNRIVLPPMGTNLGEADGSISQIQLNYYARRAAGGAGMAIVEISAVHASGWGPHGVAIFDDRYMPGLNELARVIQQQGAKAVIQLYHGGRQLSSKITGRQTVAPSPIASPVIKEVPRELTREEIHELVEAFAEGARRARDAGFDAVEFHGAHGYLICQFLSPVSNHRNDEYGGDLWRRTRFARDILRRAREKVGKDYPILFRIDGKEYVEGGLTLDEARSIAGILEEWGADAIHVSAGQYASIEWAIQPMSFPPAPLVPLAAEIKQVVNVPVITVGRIGTPDLAEEILTSGKADLIAMGRILLADPDLPRKAMEGRVQEIRRCLSCNQCFYHIFNLGQAIRCAVNPEVGREGKLNFAPTREPKRVVVVGGGPGGMEAARVARMRNHQVSLLEADQKLGGKLPVAASAPSKRDIARLTEFLVYDLYRLKVDIQTGMRATAEDIQSLHPDVVVLATGSIPIIPEIPGIEECKAVQAEQVLSGYFKPVGGVVIIGASSTGCETAELLLENGISEITILARGTRIASSTEPMGRRLLRRKLEESGVKILTQCSPVQVSPEGVAYADHEGKEHFMPADTVILARGYEAYNPLQEQLESSGIKVIAVGDCVQPRGILEAIHEGAEAACSI
ncbi:MAG: oxidoreductase [Bacillota bacterium]